MSPPEFGYKVQALAAHVLLRLGYRIKAINQSGHPDIVAVMDGREIRLEVEAEVAGPRLRKLSEDDFISLVGMSGVFGYYALAISFPSPRWVLVPADRLIGRNPSSDMLLEALSDRPFSDDFTREYVNLLNRACLRIRRESFGEMCRSALADNPL